MKNKKILKDGVAPTNYMHLIGLQIHNGSKNSFIIQRHPVEAVMKLLR